MHDGTLFVTAQSARLEVACRLLDPQCRQGPSHVGWRHTLVYLFPSQRRMDTGSLHGFCRSRTHTRTSAEGIGDAARHLEFLHVVCQSARKIRVTLRMLPPLSGQDIFCWRQRQLSAVLVLLQVSAVSGSFTYILKNGTETTRYYATISETLSPLTSNLQDP